MQKKNTFFSLTMPHIAILAMVLLAIVMMFFINKYFECRIKMLRHQGAENAAVSAVWTYPYQNTSKPAQPMLTNCLSSTHLIHTSTPPTLKSLN